MICWTENQEKKRSKSLRKLRPSLRKDRILLLLPILQAKIAASKKKPQLQYPRCQGRRILCKRKRGRPQLHSLLIKMTTSQTKAKRRSRIIRRLRALCKMCHLSVSRQMQIKESWVNSLRTSMPLTQPWLTMRRDSETWRESLVTMTVNIQKVRNIKNLGFSL